MWTQLFQLFESAGLGLVGQQQAGAEARVGTETDQREARRSGLIGVPGCAQQLQKRAQGSAKVLKRWEKHYQCQCQSPFKLATTKPLPLPSPLPCPNPPLSPFQTPNLCRPHPAPIAQAQPLFCRAGPLMGASAEND